jgi:predicted GIY-YIG superfamily endonuclease
VTAAGVPGTVYLLHFDQPYQHARHYIGWTLDLAKRLAAHARGQGARLLAVVRDAGIGWELARTWPGTRTRERQLKNQGGAARRCPLCGVRPRTEPAPAAAVPARLARAVAPPPALPRPSAYERGAALARAMVAALIAAGKSPAQIEAADAAMHAHYDPARARPEAREWHRGWVNTAAALVAAMPPVPADASPRAGHDASRLHLTALAHPCD